MPLDLIDDKSTLVQVMAWCHQATSHYLGHCWPSSMSPNGITMPKWVKCTSDLAFTFMLLLNKQIHLGCKINCTTDISTCKHLVGQLDLFEFVFLTQVSATLCMYHRDNNCTERSQNRHKTVHHTSCHWNYMAKIICWGSCWYICPNCYGVIFISFTHIFVTKNDFVNVLATLTSLWYTSMFIIHKTPKSFVIYILSVLAGFYFAGCHLVIALINSWLQLKKCTFLANFHWILLTYFEIALFILNMIFFQQADKSNQKYITDFYKLYLNKTQWEFILSLKLC